MLPLGLFPLRTSGSRRMSLILLRRRARRRIRLCHFSTLIDIVAETALSPLEQHCPLASHSQHSPELFVHAVLTLILDHGVSLIIFISGAKIIISYILLDTSFHHRFQSVIIRSSFLLMKSPGHTIPIRS